jgi:cysteinyl-tRNA synthetase
MAWIWINSSVSVLVTADLSAACRDLIHPHHDNELVQSQAAACGCDKEALYNGVDFVRLWMHLGFVNGTRLRLYLCCKSLSLD